VEITEVLSQQPYCLLYRALAEKITMPVQSHSPPSVSVSKEPHPTIIRQTRKKKGKRGKKGKDTRPEEVSRATRDDINRGKSTTTQDSRLGGRQPEDTMTIATEDIMI
jgi:hypothetical protein